MRCVVLLFFIEIVSSSNQWVRFETKCFQINSEKMNRSMAIQTCQQRGAVLTSISNQSEWDFLTQTVNSTVAYWVWVSRKNGTFQWEDGTDCCPVDWWSSKYPVKDNETCAKFYKSWMLFRLYGTQPEELYGFICSKSTKSWVLVNSGDYNFMELCGVEIMPNCKGIICETACESHHDCNQFAKISNLCVNVKNVSETDNCIIRLTTNTELYNFKDNC